MALQSSGAISFTDLQTEFGGVHPISLSEYYRTNGLAGGGAPLVPETGAIGLNDFYGAQAAIVVNITGNASNVNLLTLAQAEGYSTSDTTPVIVNINSGVTISGSGTRAITTGGFNANSDLTINISGTINGYTGSNGGTSQNGSAGGDALYVNTSTGGSGAITVNVLSGGKLRGGGGGGGGRGNRGQVRAYDGKYGTCYGGWYYGSFGSTGSAGSYGNNGSNGTSGTWSPSLGNRHPSCIASYPSSGGSGGAAGRAIRKNGRTVTLNNSGTVNGSAS